MLNYRHPGPRRVWIGGSEPQPTGTFPEAPENCRDPLACSKIMDFGKRVVTFGPGRRSRVMFFGLFQTASCKSLTFETIFGRRPTGDSTPAKSTLEDHKKVRKIMKILKKVSFFQNSGPPKAAPLLHPCLKIAKDLTLAKKTLEPHRRL